jgi:predicted nucleic acid-binding protein
MRVLLDTNVVLDVLLRRGPWLAQAETLWDASRAGTLESCINASSLTDIYYISRRLVGREKARQVVRACLDVLTILPVDASLLEAAFGVAASDFEDGLQIAAAKRSSLDAIVTRNVADYAASEVPVFLPLDFARQLKPSQSGPQA